jgi:hypothetical protein
VFLAYSVSELGRQAELDPISKLPISVSQEDNTSDWQGTKAAAASNGARVDLYGFSNVTGEKALPRLVSDTAFEGALKNSDVVIYVGHGSGDPGRVPFQQQGIQVGNTYYTAGGTGPSTMSAVKPIGDATGPKPQTAASLVVSLSCDSSKNAGAYFNFVGKNQVMVTLNSSGDGLDGGVTSMDALDKAANAFVRTYVETGGNIEKAVEAANKVLQSLPGNEGQNVGDKIEAKPVN